MLKVNENFYDKELKKYFCKGDEYKGKNKKRIEELKGDNLHDIVFLVEEENKEVNK